MPKFTAISIKRIAGKKLSTLYVDAIEESPCGTSVPWDQIRVRIETYKARDIRRLLKIWKWEWVFSPSRPHSDDDARVKRIMELAPTEGWWPYISYRASDMRQLATVKILVDEEVDVLYHGDGWHRVIAALECKLPTIEILFFEKEAHTH